MTKTPIYTGLKDYIKRDITHFDVPGHKRRPNSKLLCEFLDTKLKDLDISCSKDMDFLGNPSGIIKESQNLMANAFSSENAFFLINGTTSGIQAMILGTIKPKDKIIIPRNVHRSVLDALILSGGEPIYVEPIFDEKLGIAHGVDVSNFRRIVEDTRGIKAALFINPTYFGAVSDLESLIKIAHSKDILVLVDEAHGAHFYFNDSLPKGAMELGADLSAVSLHKTGGSLTQSSVLLSHNKRIDPKGIQVALNLLQSTSPSYVLLSSLDITRKVLSDEGEKIFNTVLEIAEYGRKQINKIGGYYCIGNEILGTPGVHNLDLTKLSINVSDISLTGMEVYDILRDEYSIQVEICEVKMIMAMCSLGDSKNKIDILVDALKDIKIKHGKDKKYNFKYINEIPQMVLSPREAFYANKRIIKLKDAGGEISGEFIMAYPPGIPIIAPGEKITENIVEYIEFLKTNDCILTGLEDPMIEYIYVIGS